MSRISESDFIELEGFLKNYSLSSDLGAQARLSLLKRAHRHLLSALQVWWRISALSEAGSAEIHERPLLIDSEAISFIGEYFSDLTCSVSCLVHGLYKPANMQLRSAIESLVRGLAGLDSLEARQTKSVYRLFELAGDLKPFEGESAPDFSALQQIYGDLCLHVHSATPAHRAGMHCVAAHMKQDTAKMKEIVVLLERVNRAALSVLVRADKRLYLGAPKIQDLLDEVLPKDVRLAALGSKKDPQINDAQLKQLGV